MPNYKILFETDPVSLVKIFDLWLHNIYVRVRFPQANQNHCLQV